MQEITPFHLYVYINFPLVGILNALDHFLSTNTTTVAPVTPGWMVVLDSTKGCCPWENVPYKPYFLYSATDDTVTYQSGSAGRIHKLNFSCDFSIQLSKANEVFRLLYYISWFILKNVKTSFSKRMLSCLFFGGIQLTFLFLSF